MGSRFHILPCHCPSECCSTNILIHLSSVTCPVVWLYDWSLSLIAASLLDEYTMHKFCINFLLSVDRFLWKYVLPSTHRFTASKRTAGTMSSVRRSYSQTHATAKKEQTRGNESNYSITTALQPNNPWTNK